GPVRAETCRVSSARAAPVPSAASVGSRPRDVNILFDTLQSTSERPPDLSRQLGRGRVLQDVPNLVDREVGTNVAQRLILAQLSQNVRSFVWFELGEMTKKPPIVAEHC